MLFHQCTPQCPPDCGADAPARVPDPARARSRTFTVDLHCHALFPAVEKLVAGLPQKLAEPEMMLHALGAATVDYNNKVMLPQAGPKLTNLAQRLADMDAIGVDMQLVSPTSTQHYYWAEPDLAAEVVRIQNEGMAELCATHPARFLGLGTLALQHPALAIEQLEHAVRKLGLRGVEISTMIAGKELADPMFESFWAKVEELGCIVFIHPFGTTLGARLDRYYLSNVIGQPLETTIALSHLIFGGVLDRYPGVKILAAHGGGYLPSYIGRSNHAHRARTDTRGCARAPGEYLRQIWFDNLVYEPEALRHLIAEVGVGQVVTGTDYPFDMGQYALAALLEAAPGLSQEEREGIAWRNAERLLGQRLRPEDWQAPAAGQA
ncbi:amidohydrolase family protein [Massilia norwichensis]|uniref:Amidohydrolase n=1 Tax=Massilia norwichensis TaxID=1442366 RepID=A0ABT2ADU2_9BURK|nr:amidohydrolase family protein [Massilia norwichensis]MCS0592385.1 amidohydrolase [Massilia norwichensis]